MFYNTSTEQSNRMLFMANLMQHLDGDYRFDGLVKEVLKEANDFAHDRITLYQVSRQRFRMVMYLLSLDKEFIRNLDAGNMREDDYRKLLDLMRKGEASPYPQF